MILVHVFGGTIHDARCKSVRRDNVYKIVAPDLHDDEVASFIAARGLTARCCRTCLRKEIAA